MTLRTVLKVVLLLLAVAATVAVVVMVRSSGILANGQLLSMLLGVHAFETTRWVAVAVLEAVVPLLAAAAIVFATRHRDETPAKGGRVVLRRAWFVALVASVACAFFTVVLLALGWVAGVRATLEFVLVWLAPLSCFVALGTVLALLFGRRLSILLLLGVWVLQHLFALLLVGGFALFLSAFPWAEGVAYWVRPLLAFATTHGGYADYWAANRAALLALALVLLAFGWWLAARRDRGASPSAGVEVPGSPRVAGRAIPQVVLVAVLGVAAFAGLGAAWQPAVGTDGVHRCAGWTMSRCEGAIEVPLDWSEPGGEKISVAFSWTPRGEISRPASGTIFGAIGGPAEALSSTNLYRQTLDPALARQNLLMMDPRGFGRSSPLRCTAAALASLQMSLEDVRRCADQVGGRSQSFNTASAARDLDAVRRALDVPELRVYGTSYGTLFSQSYAALFPGKVEALALDSVIDPESAIPTQVPPGLENLRRICERSPGCEASGDPIRRWTEVVERVRKEESPPISMDNLIQLTVQSAEAVVGRETNAAATSYLAGDPAPIRRLNTAFETWRETQLGGGLPAVPPGGDDTAAVLSYICHDYNYAFDRTAEPADKQRQLAEWYTSPAGKAAYAPFTKEEYLAPVNGADEPDWCSVWPTPERDDPPVPSGSTLPDVPSLVINGELDTTTPPADAEAVAARLPDVTLFIVPFGDHSSSFGMSGPYSICVRDIVRRFLDEPAAPLTGLNCSAEYYRALGTFPIQLSEVEPSDPVAEDNSTGRDRRLAAAAALTASDATARQLPTAQIFTSLPNEEGLRGGTLEYDESGSNVKIELDGTRFVKGVTVTGTVRVDQDSYLTEADLKLTGPEGARGDLQVRWDLLDPGAPATITGQIEGRFVEARTLLL